MNDVYCFQMKLLIYNSVNLDLMPHMYDDSIIF